MPMRTILTHSSKLYARLRMTNYNAHHQLLQRSLRKQVQFHNFYCCRSYFWFASSKYSCYTAVAQDGSKLQTSSRFYLNQQTELNFCQRVFTMRMTSARGTRRPTSPNVQLMLFSTLFPVQVLSSYPVGRLAHGNF
jgi:hypothetical protein